MSTGNDRPDVSAVGLSIQEGAAGMGLTVDTSIKPIWGEITGNDPVLDRPHFYQWKEVHFDIRETTGKPSWKADSDIQASMGYGSSVDESDARVDTLMNPAVELGEHSVAMGSVVRLYPTNVTTDANGFTQRFWLFTLDKLRPFLLLEHLVNTGIAYDGNRLNPDDNTAMDDEDALPTPQFATGGQRATSIKALWLDIPNEFETTTEVTLYAKHTATWFDPYRYLNYGFAGPRGHFTAGATGWATYVPKATIIDLDEEGKPIWRAEWQIVTLDTSPILKAWIWGVVDPDDLLDPRTIQPGEVGDAATNGTTDARLPVSWNPWRIKVYNNLPVPLTIGSLHNLYWSPDYYIWLPVTPLATPHGRTIYAPEGIAVPPEIFTTVPMRTTIGKYGEEIIAADLGLQNVGGLALVGIVSWTVTARRVISGAGGDIDSRLEAALFLNGNQVPGTASGLTSSRRIVGAAGEGANATNSLSNTVVLIVDAGEVLQIKARVVNPADDEDKWQTVGSQCTLTFRSISSFLGE